ncbi:hypothetical protein OTAKU_00470 [Serratia phage vB_SmaM-Otaku]|uniref:Uncharacterized protein n=1 Tax=Serratia phage vB_SmaM-Otaku TaxID=2932867 RepID=A0AAE9HFN4_9CAUD|nr:hypothetical protein PF631_gp47 [Serratia phage vB_SmaM-Otaku]UPU16036.1 hypothetical protein OTAKU_00470 [Serratia phage vB_SmaM-Otaku]
MTEYDVAWNADKTEVVLFLKKPDGGMCDRVSLAELEAAMCHIPSWERGFPLAAEGDIMYRYRK